MSFVDEDPFFLSRAPLVPVVSEAALLGALGEVGEVVFATWKRGVVERRRAVVRVRGREVRRVVVRCIVVVVVVVLDVVVW